MTYLDNDPSYQLINSLTFCVFDLETTGGNHINDKIIEIGLVKIENMQITDQLSFLINPEMHIPDFIQKLTDIKDIDVARSPKIEEVIDQILEFMGDSILVAHNTSFDVPFFNSVLRRLDRPEIKNKSLCTNLMTKYMIPNLLSSNLNYMSNVFGLEHQKAHRALDDAKAAGLLLLKYLQIFIDKKISKINSLYYPIKKFELDRINFKKDVPKEEIIAQINKINTPFAAFIKGAEGVVQFAMPCRAVAKEKDYLIKMLSAFDYEMVTLKLIGPYFQGLLETSSMFTKLNSEVEEELMKKLCEFNNIDYDFINNQVAQGMPSDFIVLNHLNPEHFVIYPLASLGQKMELVFKYPTHQNKLIQYINSKSARLVQDKLRKDHFKPIMNNFIIEYLKINEDFVLFNKQTVKITNLDIKDKMEDFIENHAHNYNFPQNYL